MINRQRVKQHFSKAAANYDEAAIVQRRTAEDIAERTLLLSSKKAAILELGCGTGLLTAQLVKHYPDAAITAVDFSANMLKYAKSRLTLKPPFWQVWSAAKSSVRWVQADAYCLPFEDASFDLIVSNFMLQWCQDLDKVFAEMRRVVRPGGAILFSTFGPDTLKELRQAWLCVEGDVAHQRFNEFIDMHDLGDALIRNGFGQPVMDVEQVHLIYDDAMQVMRDLKILGATQANQSHQARRGMLGRGTLSAVITAYDQYRNAQGKLPATFEVVQGHAWASIEVIKGPNRDKTGVVNITLDELAEQLKSKRKNF